MRKTISAIILAITTLGSLSAQNSETETIYLKNGSVIKGKVTEFIPNKTITIATESGSTFVINAEDMEKYERPTSNYKSRREEKLAKKNAAQSMSYLETGYRGFFNGEFLAGDVFQMGVTTTHGYQINKNLFVGGGIGMKVCEDDYKRVPLFASLRVDPKPGKFSPFVEGRFGYELIDDKDGGTYGSINGGFRIKSFNLSMGFDMYRYYETNDFYGEGDKPTAVEESLDGISFNIRVGFEF